MNRIVILGAGGQARDVAWLINETGAHVFVGFVAGSKPGLHDSPALGGNEWLRANPQHFDAFALGIGTPAVRLRVAYEADCLSPVTSWPVLVHPSARFDRRTCHFGRGTTIGAGVVGSVGIVVGEYACVNLGVTLGHEAKIGDGVVINHNASIAGGVTIGRGALIGTNATVLQYLTIGEGATVGAGAVVTHNVPAGETWVGVPARPMGKRRAA